MPAVSTRPILDTTPLERDDLFGSLPIGDEEAPHSTTIRMWHAGQSTWLPEGTGSIPEEAMSPQLAELVCGLWLQIDRATQEGDASRPIVLAGVLDQEIRHLAAPGRGSQQVAVSPSLVERAREQAPSPMRPASAWLMAWLESGPVEED